MFLDYYKLAEQPFGVTPDERFLYLGPKHAEALASLVYGTESDRGFLALIAEPGMGKTTLLYHYLNYLKDRARTAFVFRTDCDSRDFIRYVLADLGVKTSGMDMPTMHDALSQLLVGEMKAGRRFVLVVDEAQTLEDKTLESIRLLSNFETPWKKLMLIVLAGQPQLADTLTRPSMSQLRQRISMAISIKPLALEEVNAYIDHRLWVSGGKTPALFTFGARSLIAEYSRGVPRNINNICFNALSLGCALRRETIDRDIIRQVVAELDLDTLKARSNVAIDFSPPPKGRNRVEERAAMREKRTRPTIPNTYKTKPVTSSVKPRMAIVGVLLTVLLGYATELNRNEFCDDHAKRQSATPPSASSIPDVSAANIENFFEQGGDSAIGISVRSPCGISIDDTQRGNAAVFEKGRELDVAASDPACGFSVQRTPIPSTVIIPEVAEGPAQPIHGIPTVGTERQ